MSANEGSGNPNGTSGYFNNGSADGNSAGFFDHNQPNMNQWGFPPPDQTSAPGGIPQTSQHQQQYQPQQTPQFYNPAEFQKAAPGQQPEIFNPYGGGNAYQPQQPLSQDGFQQQNDFSQQQFNQNDHGGSLPQPQQQPQNPEVADGQVPYQQGWQGYGAPADSAEQQDSHWQNQDNHTGQQANASYPSDPYSYSGYGYGTDMHAPTSNHQESGQSENPTQKFEQEDSSGNSGFGAFFHDDGSDFVISSDKGSEQVSANVSERTSPNMVLPDSNSQLQMDEQGHLQESAQSEKEQSNSNIEHFQLSPQSNSHIATPVHDQVPERNMATLGDMQDKTTESSESSVLNQDSQSVAVPSSTFGSSHDLGSAMTEHSNFEELNTESLGVNQTPDDRNVQHSEPHTNIEPAQSELSIPDSLVSNPAENVGVVHELLSVPVSSLSVEANQQDSDSLLNPTPPAVSQEQSLSSSQSDGGDLPSRGDGLENTPIPATNFGPPSTQNVGQTDASVFSAQTLPHLHQQTQEQPYQQPQQQSSANSSQSDLTSPPNLPLLSTQSSLETKKASEPEDNRKQRSDSLSSGSHPSAFRQVRSIHGHRDISVNPSPPLWQAEVPALPGNILLAPALNISTSINPIIPSSTLSSPSLSTPRQLADTVASVSVPPVPSVAASLLAGTNIPGPKPPVSSNSQPSATSAPTPVQQVTQSVSQLDISKTVPNTSASAVPSLSNPQSVPVSQQPQLPNPTPNPNPSTNPVAYVQPVSLSQPNPIQPTTQQQNIVQPQASQAQPGVSIQGVQPTNPAVVPQVSGVVTASQQQSQQFSSTLPIQPQQNNMNNPPVQQQSSVPGQQGVTPMQPQQPLQQDYHQQQIPQQQQQQQQQVPPQQQQQQVPPQQQQQPFSQQQQPQGPQSQQPGYNQYPPGQGGQYYPNPANRQPYPQGGYYQGGGYGPGYRGYGYGSPYARQGSYSRQDPYYQGYSQHMQRSQQRTADAQGWERPQSRQGNERPRSRQGWPDEQDYDPRYQRSRRDPRYYGGVDEYGRPYDRRYYEYYRRKQIGQYKDREYQKYYEQQRNRSGSQQYSQDSSLNASDASQTEKKDASQNESFSEEFHHQGGGTPEQYGSNQSAIYPSGYDNYDPRWRRDQGYYDSANSSDRATYDGSQYYNQDYSWQQEEPQPTSYTPPPPERRTPVKHSLPHVIARFSPGGQLIKVLPNVPADGMPAMVEIHNVETMVEHCDEIAVYKGYPGPLIKGETHKNDVLHFAATQATDCRRSTDLSDKESAALLWDLLVLLCRQNGTVVETDISDLLLKDHPMTSRESSSQEEAAEGEASQDGADVSDLLSELPKTNDAQDAVKQTHRFRELLLFGRKKEALEWAMKKGLWGHALLLASKMDNRTHASVMTRFANSLPMNDPLQTLYQLMSDRQPAAVTSCNDEKWGDWRPHLAMVMSNLSSSADVGFKSVVTLGDSLSSRGLLHASQFCYLMAQVGFGIYSKKTTKIVLLGSSHNLPFSKFSTNSAIQLTEIYEYAQMLANKHFLIPNFQAYKFIYACRLADFGFTSQALRYCETIANTIQCSPNYYNSTLVSQVCQLSHRLKHHDPEFHDLREITEPQWIVPLEAIVMQINEGQLKPPSSSGTPMPWVESSSNLSTLGVESTDGTVQGVGEGVSAYQYEGYQQEGYQQDQVGGQGYEGQDDQQQVNQYQDQQTDQQQVPFYDYNQQQQQQDGTQTTGQQQQQQQQNPYYQYDNYQPYNTQPMSSNFPPNQDPGASIGSNFSEYSTTTNPSETEGDSTEFEQSGASQFDFNSYNKMVQQNRSRTNTLSSMGGPPSPQKTLTPPDSPNTFTAPRPRTRTTSGGSTVSVASQKGQQKQQQQQQPEPKETKPQNKPKPKSSQGGWLRWFNKKLGGSNIHLPDDTKKTIEWDPVKKQWVNKAEDADEADSGPPPPPPSDKEISGPAPPAAGPPATSQPPISAPGLGGGLGGGLGQKSAPPAGVNKFSRKFGPGNYVDVLNKGKGTSALAKTGDTSSLFQTLPAPSNTAPVNFFIPDSSASEDTQTSNQEGDPQVGNPGSRPHSPHREQGGGQQSENLSRSSSMSDLSNEVSQHMSHQPTTQPPPSWPQEGANASQQPAQQPAQQPGVPMFYNPQSFANQGGAATGFGVGGSSGGASKRGYGQPRQYPKQR
ncbi:protein transport protein Sec16A-like isoform X2 [Lytechinus variegatus]|uniref:protein transport protein Sec16A-like isoform X2 n=1 Tax=Lytechinus variegatus TaxID=7654 RepID=UPI001BB0D7EE|nr:protein transport protein Sec16A-like isoform X2 [Lytechinus variegatus]